MMKYADMTGAKNLMAALSNHQDSNKDIEFILSAKESQVTDYRLFYCHVLAVHQQLLNAGLQAGDELVLVTDDVAFFTVLFWAALSAGITPVPLAFPNSDSAAEKLQSVWGQLASPWLTSDKPLDDVLARYVPDFSRTIASRIIHNIDLHKTDHSNELDIYDADPDDIAFIQFSSGSTGSPKGVVVTHKMLLADCAGIVAANNIDNADRFFSWLPLSHDFGIIYYMILPVIYGLPFCLMSTKLFARHPVLWLDKMNQTRATATGAPNYAFEHVMKMFKPEAGKNWDLSCLKVVLNGAEPIDLAICQRFNACFGKYGLSPTALTPAYGLAEGTLVVTTIPLDEEVIGYSFDRNQLKVGDFVKEDPQGSYFADNGFPLNCVDVRISDDTCQEFDNNRVGSIQIRGESVTHGYYRDPDRIKQSLTSDGWLETGDLGFLRKGRLIVTGRSKDLIIVNGVNYYPQDIENICTLLPSLGLNKVVACSVSSQGSEKFALFLLFRQSSAQFLPLIKDVEELLIRELGIKPDYCLPIKKIPKTTSGKLRRFDLVRQFNDGQFNNVIKQLHEEKQQSDYHPLKRALLNGDQYATLDALLNLVLPLSHQQELPIDIPLMELGFKSVHITEVMFRINDVMQRDWPISFLFDFSTLNEMAEGLIFLVAEELKQDPKQTITNSKMHDAIQKNIGIIGIGCQFPGNADGVDAFWQLLNQQTELVNEAPPQRWQINAKNLNSYPGLNKGYFINDPWLFDHRFFNISPLEAQAMDPQQRRLLECSWQAFEDAGIDPKQWKNKKVGVFLGLSNIDYDKINPRSPNPDDLNGYAITGSAASIAAGRIAYFYGFNGPVMTIDTACSSSLVAVHHAIGALQRGECELALVGGTNLMLDEATTAALVSMKALSPTGQSKAFSQDADGYGRGEGCAVVVLKRLQDAQNNNDKVWALIKGSAINHDGASNGLTAPSSQAQQALLHDALENADCKPQEIDFIETHGTGTPLGDPIEVNALNKVYQKREIPLMLGSVKSNIGHLEAAAGIAGLVKSALALHYRLLPASLHAKELNNHIDWQSMALRVATSHQMLNADICHGGVSAFGLSGTNSHVILSSYKKPIKDEDILKTDSVDKQYLTLSAQDPEAFNMLVDNWQHVINEQNETQLINLCIGASTQRTHLCYRKRLKANNKLELQAQLEKAKNARLKACNTDNRVVFVFPGQGSQYPEMAAELYQKETYFRQTIEHMAHILDPVLPYGLVQLLTSDQDEAVLGNTEITQPLLVAFEVALAKLWQYWGVEPTACIGHSIGELAAAVISESLSVEAGLLLAAERGRILASLPKGGAMAAVMSDVETVQLHIDKFSDGKVLAIAAHNDPNNVTLSGSESQLLLCLEKLTESGIKTRRLSVSHAFHSPFMAAAESDFSIALNKVQFKSPKYHILSTVTGERLTSEQWKNPNYWIDQLTHPVLFHEAVMALKADNRYQCIEISARPSLISCGRRCQPEANWIGSLSLQEPLNTLNDSMSLLYEAGIDFNWQHYYPQNAISRLSLPNYPFQPHSHKPKNLNIQMQESKVSEPQNHVQTMKLHSDNNRLANQVYDLISSISGLPVERLDGDANWFSLGLDSLVIVQIQQAIVKRFAIDIPYTMLMAELDTVNKLLARLIQEIPEVVEEVTPEVANNIANVNTSNENTNNELNTLFEQQIQAMSSLFEKQLSILPNSHVSMNTSTNRVDKQEVKLSKAIVKPGKEIKGLFQSIKTEKGAELNLVQQQHLTLLTQEYTHQTAASKQYVAKHRKHYANSRSIIGFKPETKELAYPIHVNKAKGVQLWDLDGNQYIDITMGFGSILFGHNPDFIRDAIAAELDRGAAVGPQSLLPARVAQKLCAMTRTDRAAFFTTGTEAIMVAVRIARTVTVRKKIVIFQGAFHGSFDSVLASGWVEADGPVTVPLTDGTTQGMIDDTIVLKYGEPDSLEIIKQYADEIAAVLIEPVQSRDPALQPIEFVKSLRSLTNDKDITLICDDMIIGFRYAPDGCQSWLGIEPDLLTYGKVIGGGQPIGVLAGKKRFMDAVDGGNWEYGDDSVPGTRAAFVAGTYNNHPVAMAAAEAVLDRLHQAGPQLQQQLNLRTENMCQQLNLWFELYQLPFKIVWFGSLFRFEFGDKAELLNFHLLKNGLYVWEGRNCFLGEAHNDEDIIQIVAIIKRSVWEMISGGWLGGKSCDNQLTKMPLSQGQKAMRYMLLAKPEMASAYTEMMIYKFDHSLDHDLLEQAWAVLLQRHEVLRVISLNEHHQVIAASINSVISHFSLENDDVEQAKKELLQQAYNLNTGPFWRLQLIDTPNGSHFLMSFSHMIVDGWSMGILAMELAKVYQGLLQGFNVDLPHVISYRQFIAKQCWQQVNDITADVNYDAENTQEPLYLTGDGALYAPRSDIGYRLQHKSWDLLYDSVKAFSKEHACSPASILLSAWVLLLNRISLRDDIVVGIPTAGHSDMGSGHMVGYASTVNPLLIEIQPEQTLKILVHKTAKALLQVQTNPSHFGSLPVTNLFNIDRGVNLDFGQQPQWERVPVNIVKQDLFLNILEFNDKAVIDFDVRSDLASKALAHAWLGQYLKIVSIICTNPDKILNTLVSDISPAQPAVVDQSGMPLFKKTLIECLHSNDKTSLSLESYQGALALRVPNKSHRLASITTLAVELAHKVASKFQPKYLIIDGESVYKLIQNKLAPSNAPELALARLWATELGIELPGVNQSFISLGGNSLTALTIINRMQTELDINVSINEFLSNDSITQLLALSSIKFDSTEYSQCNLIEPRTDKQVLSTSNSQKGLLTLQAIEPNSIAYNIGFTLNLGRHISLGQLINSLTLLVARHQSLACYFVDYQVCTLWSKKLDALVTEMELTTEELAQTDEQYEVERIFYLDQQLPWRVRLQQLPQSSRLVITMHHVISDVWSVEVFTQELLSLLQAQVFNYPAQLPELKIQYCDYVAAMQAHQLKTEFEKGLLSYVHSLEPLPEAVDLVPDKPRQNTRCREGNSQFKQLTPELSQKLYQLSTELGHSLYAISMAAVGALVNQQTGAEEMVLGTVSAQRNNPELAHLIGFFVNTLAVKLKVAGNISTIDLIDHSAQQINHALQYSDLPIEQIIDRLNLPRIQNRQHLLDIVLVMDERQELNNIAQSFNATIKEVPVKFNQFDFTLYMSMDPQGIVLHALYNTGLYSASRIDALLAALETIFETFVNHSDKSINMGHQAQSNALSASQKQIYNLTAQQKRLWFVDAFENGYLYESGPVYYNMPLQLRLNQHPDISLLQQVFDGLVMQQPLLQSNIVIDNTCAEHEMFWHMHRAGKRLVPIYYIDESCEAPLSTLSKYNFKPFDLACDCLLRLALATLQDGSAILQLTCHHIIADKSALRRFMQQLLLAYQGAVNGTDQPINTLDEKAFFTELTNYSALNKQSSTQQNYWKNQLQGITALQLPEDIRRKAVHIYEGEQINLSLTGLPSLAHTLGCDEKTLSLTLFHCLLNRYSRQQDIVTGVVCPYQENTSGLAALDNLVVIRSKVEAQKSLSDFVKELEFLLAQASNNRNVLFDDLVLAINPKNDMSRTALFDVLYIFEDQCLNEQEIGGGNREILSAEGWGKYDIVLVVAKSHSGSNQISLCFNKTIYQTSSMNSLLNNFQALIDNAAMGLQNNKAVECGQLCLITQAQQQVKLNQCNISVDYPIDESLVSAFTKTVKQYPQKIALSDGEQKLTFTELDQLSTALAKHLKVAGVGCETLVALYMDRGITQPICLLAILKAGGAYLVLDKKQPLTRLQQVACDAGVDYLLTDKSADEQALSITNRLFVDSQYLDEPRLDSIWCDLPEVNLPKVKADQLAYMIYTSGSTGIPKGVQIEHKNVIQLILNEQMPLEFSAQDNWSLFHSCAFDFSVWEIFTPWLTGGKVQNVPLDIAVDSAQFLNLILTQQITILNQTPGAFYALLKQLEDRQWPELPLRMVIFGGEALQPSRLSAFIEHYPEVKLVNMYGITETTVHVTYHILSPADCEVGLSNIGKPLPGYQVLLVDEQLKPCPVGVPGEMLISGSGVSRGYFNRPELNKQAFIALDGINATVFRSGDLARYLPDGKLIYMGRIDQQVQFRGFRIELGEIEQVLLKHPLIKDVAIKLHANGEQDDNKNEYLVAWLVFENEQETLIYEQIVSFLGDRLPEYMIPQMYFSLDKIPLNTNGKVDRKLLVESSDKRLLSKSISKQPDKINNEAFSHIEKELISIWCEVMGLEQVASDDNFFEIGGHSLTANSALLRIKQKLCDCMTLKDFFSAPHLSVQAMLIMTLNDNKTRTKTDWPILKKQPLNTSPLPSFSQQRLWLVQAQDTLDTSYNVVGIFNIQTISSDKTVMPDFLDIYKGLSYAFEQVIKRHDVLRTNFCLKDGKLQLSINSGLGDFVLNRIEQLGIDIEHMRQEALNYAFDLENDCLIQASLIKGDNNINAFLLVNMHHIINDGASVTLLMQELAQFYSHYRANKEAPISLQPLKVQFQDYAYWQLQLHTSGALNAQIQYWETMYADGIPVLNLPSDFPRPEQADHKGAIKIDYLGLELSAQLRGLSQELGITLFMLLSCITQLMLYRRSGQTDFVVGTPIAGRDDLALEPLIGFFLNVLPLRLALQPQQTLKQQLLQNSQLITETYANQNLAFDQLLEVVGYQKQIGRHAMFDVQLILQNNTPLPTNFSDIYLELQEEQSISAKFDLNIMFGDQADIELQLEYATALFTHESATSINLELIAIAKLILQQREALETITVEQLLADLSPVERYQNIDVHKKGITDNLNTNLGDSLIEDEEW
ncbi:hybrid non-ribosomal peptide synthetase/type I polyketide synthase [Pseudoalteromonas denitrificans]|uniref:Amino acid adenylation domain-containing protein n=1 Tax=Pseudoalteromonas denitrificans DSM 6059 TaxID=1123010 RepID=A0A1I1DZ55_9GAMM|nr:hybrid non-ribosomal peptide synthetase/type I polyketide synthase [Pseudoalteromonas denitrificans]SFB79672.1 amino acid adenylation domain-containing protein [Pseudoalteromonas denitrificans DSM 6059]